MKWLNLADTSMNLMGFANQFVHHRHRGFWGVAIRHTALRLFGPPAAAFSPFVKHLLCRLSSLLPLFARVGDLARTRKTQQSKYKSTTRRPRVQHAVTNGNEVSSFSSGFNTRW